MIVWKAAKRREGVSKSVERRPLPRYAALSIRHPNSRARGLQPDKLCHGCTRDTSNLSEARHHDIRGSRDRTFAVESVDELYRFPRDKASSEKEGTDS